jgi:4-aminobutyrate aminotransferase/(S)-3-amino-2-methylpropionate transaminase
MGLTSKAMPYKAGFGPFAPDVYHAPMSYPYRDGLSGVEAAAHAIHMMERQIGADRLAAIIIEPIQGEGGFVVPAPGFLPALQTWANDNGVVFIADEVQTGFARTGQMFASEHEGIVPDLITLAKGIAGGLPLAAVTGRADIMDAPHAGGLGGTYGGNPIATAAALGALRAYDEHDLLGRARELEAIILDELTTLQARDGRIGDIRGRGAMMAIELVDQDGRPDAALTAAVAKHCHVRGVVVLTCGTDGNVIRLLPPLSISDALLREGIGVIAEGLEAN